MNTEQIMALAEKWRRTRVCEWAVSDSYKALQAAIEALVQERDAFHERLTVQAHRVAHWIEKHDDIKASRDEYQREADKLAMENKVLRDAVHSCGPTCSKAGCINRRLRDALKDIESGTYDTWSEGYRAQQIAHAALQGANHE
jgi:uncharacterized coiled-coil DUF342 family protein